MIESARTVAGEPNLVAGRPEPARWVSAHVFYHGSHDLLLLRLVAPLVEDLRARSLLAGHFFIRYWQGGPHVRCRLLPVQPGAVPEVEGAVREHTARFLAASPSPDRLTPAAYDRMTGLLARVEPDAEHVPLQPNNCLRFIDYRREHHKYGTGAAIDAVERHFEQSSDLVLDVLHRDPSPRARLGLAFAALVGAAATGLDLWGQLRERLAQSERAWTAALDLSGALPVAEVDAAYSRQRERLQLAVLAAWSSRRTSTGEEPVDRWRRSVTRLWRELCRLEDGGAFVRSPAAGGRARLEADPAGHPAAAVALDSCAHLVCNRLGVGLPEEWYLRSLALRTVSDITGGSDRSRARRGSRRRRRSRRAPEATSAGSDASRGTHPFPHHLTRRNDAH